MRWLALALTAATCWGCTTVGSDLCAGVTCAAGRECVNGICVSRDLRPDWPIYPDGAAADLYTNPFGDGPVDAAGDATADAAGADAATDCTPGTKEITVKVHVEGLSYLRFQDNKVWWYHVSYTAPGLSTTPASPTTINKTNWTPQWPFSSGTGMHCVCESAKYDLCKAGVQLGATPKYSALSKISGPGVVAVVQVPLAGNKYRAMVLVHDTPYGSNWYEFKITFQ